MNTKVTTPNKPPVSNTYTETSAFTPNNPNFDVQPDGTLESLIVTRKEEAHKAVLKPQQMTWGFCMLYVRTVSNLKDMKVVWRKDMLIKSIYYKCQWWSTETKTFKSRPPFYI